HISSLVYVVNDTATPDIYTLSLHDALPICQSIMLTNVDVNGKFIEMPTKENRAGDMVEEKSIKLDPVKIIVTDDSGTTTIDNFRSEEHTSELQSRENLVCRLLLEKKKKTKK